MKVAATALFVGMVAVSGAQGVAQAQSAPNATVDAHADHSLSCAALLRNGFPTPAASADDTASNPGPNQYFGGAFRLNPPAGFSYANADGEVARLVADGTIDATYAPQACVTRLAG